MELLILVALAADAAKILEKIEAVLSTPALSLNYTLRSDKGGEVAGRVRLDDRERFRLEQRPFDIASDGQTLVRAGGIAHEECSAGEGLGLRMRRLLARGGVVFWIGPLAPGEGGRWIYAGQDGELELSELAEGSGEGAAKSLRYLLRHPKALRPCQVQLFYDPATFRPLRRIVEGFGPTTSETYTGWAFGAEASAESFALPRSPRFGTALRGKIARKGKLPPTGLSVGCLGVAVETFASAVDDASLVGLPPLDLKGLSWHPRKGLSYAFKGVGPGKRLLYVHLGERYFDWKWLDIPDDPRATVPETDFLLEPAKTGTVEVEASSEFVMFVPADVDGSVPRWSPRLVGAPVTARVREGKAVFAGLRPGKYVFYGSGMSWEGDRSIWGEKVVYDAPKDMELLEPPKLQVSAELKAGETRRLRLAP